MDGAERDVVDYDPVEAMREPRTARVAMPKPMLCNDGMVAWVPGFCPYRSNEKHMPLLMASVGGVFSPSSSFSRVCVVPC